MAHPEVEYLLLKYNPHNHLFSCQQIYAPDVATISENISFPLIYKEGKRVYNQEIPQAELELEITTDYGSVSVNFKDLQGNHFDKKTIDKVSFYAQGKVASYISDTLNLRMAQLLNESEEISALGVLAKYRKLNSKLQDENQILKEQLTDLEHLMKENQMITNELKELKNKWYFKFALLFKNYYKLNKIHK